MASGSVCVCVCRYLCLCSVRPRKCECLPVLCVFLHHTVFCIFAVLVVSLSCLSGLMYHLLVWGVKPWESRHRHSSCDREACRRFRVTAGWILLLFVFTVEKSAEVTYCLHPLPLSLCSSPLPLSSGISGGKPGKLWLHCFYDTKIHCVILLLVLSIEQEWELW